jgi:hypothetical protein
LFFINKQQWRCFGKEMQCDTVLQEMLTELFVRSYFQQNELLIFFYYQWQFTFVLYFYSLLYCTPIYSWTIEQIDRDIVLLLKITQIWVIAICVVLDHNTVIFQKEKGGEGTYKNHCMVCKTPIVKVDRNKNVTLNRCP